MDLQDPDLAGFVWWSLRDVRDRHLRLLKSFEELRGPATQAGKQVFAASAATLRAELAGFERTIRNYEGETLSIALEGGRAREALRIPRDRRSEHAETASQLFPYLPLGPHPPDDLRYFLMRSLGLSLLKTQDERIFSLSFSGKPFWETQQLPPNIDPPFVAVLPVPFPESLTPLRWPLLVHELGHVVDGNGQRITQDVRDRVVEVLRSSFSAEYADVEDASLQKLADELVADVIAVRSCGPAYVYAFATEALFQDPHLPWAGHLTRPALIDAQTRLRLMGYQLGALDEYTMSFDHPVLSLSEDEVGEIRDALANSLMERGAQPLVAMQLAEGAVDGIEELVRRPERAVLPEVLIEESERASEVFRSIEDVVAGGPLPQQPRGDVIATLASELSEIPASSVLVDVEGDLDSVMHQAASDAEILSAGWVAYLQNEGGSQQQRFEEESVIGPDSEIDDERIRQSTSRVVRFDTNITRALEAGAVHRWLLKYGGDA